MKQEKIEEDLLERFGRTMAYLQKAPVLSQIWDLRGKELDLFDEIICGKVILGGLGCPLRLSAIQEELKGVSPLFVAFRVRSLIRRGALSLLAFNERVESPYSTRLIIGAATPAVGQRKETVSQEKLESFISSLLERGMVEFFDSDLEMESEIPEILLWGNAVTQEGDRFFVHSSLLPDMLSIAAKRWRAASC